MNSFELGRRSRGHLHGVHSDLILVVARAIKLSEIDFAITEGVRSIERQKVLVASGASSTMRSRHLTGHAIDVAAWIGGEVRWDWPLYTRIAVAFKEASEQVHVPIEWGGDWSTFRDGPHFQLPWSAYP